MIDGGKDYWMTNTKSARPLFSDIIKAWGTLSIFYYDLTTLRKKVASKKSQAYGYNGFCYHHYWFKGKRLLETPFYMMY